MQLHDFPPPEMLSTIISGNVIIPPPPELPGDRAGSRYSLCGQSSFPAHVSLLRSLGISVLVSALVSIIVVASKSCDRAVIYEPELRHLIQAQALGDKETVNAFVKSYYFLIYALHIFIVFGSIHILVLGSIDLVPKQDTDCRFAFHFVSVFIVFIVAAVAFFSTFVAFTRPCDGLDSCCSIISSPGLLSPGDKPALTALSANDKQMLLVIVLDLVSFTALVLLGVVYFRDVRRLAVDCGYLNRVHNEGYIIREF